MCLARWRRAGCRWSRRGTSRERRGAAAARRDRPLVGRRWPPAASPPRSPSAATSRTTSTAPATSSTPACCDRAALDPGTRERVVLVAQRLEPEKRSDVALRAFAASGLAEPGWRLDVAGSRVAARDTWNGWPTALGTHARAGPLPRPRGRRPRADGDRPGCCSPRVPTRPTGSPSSRPWPAGCPSSPAGRRSPGDPRASSTRRRSSRPGTSTAAAAGCAELADDRERRRPTARPSATSSGPRFTLEAQQRATDAVYRRRDDEPRDLVVASLEAWDAVWRRNQHLVSRLLRDDPDLRVLFVEPPADPIHAVAAAARPRRGAGLRAGPRPRRRRRGRLLPLPGHQGAAPPGRPARRRAAGRAGRARRAEAGLRRPAALGQRPRGRRSARPHRLARPLRRHRRLAARRPHRTPSTPASSPTRPCCCGTPPTSSSARPPCSPRSGRP